MTTQRALVNAYRLVQKELEEGDLPIGGEHVSNPTDEQIATVMVHYGRRQGVNQEAAVKFLEDLRTKAEEERKAALYETKFIAVLTAAEDKNRRVYMSQVMWLKTLLPIGYFVWIGDCGYEVQRAFFTPPNHVEYNYWAITDDPEPASIVWAGQGFERLSKGEGV